MPNGTKHLGISYAVPEIGHGGMVDATDLKSVGVTRAGSSPAARTTQGRGPWTHKLVAGSGRFFGYVPDEATDAFGDFVCCSRNSRLSISRGNAVLQFIII